MQLPPDLLEPSTPLAPVWDALPDQHRAAVVAALARLIARAAVPEEANDDD
jgi:hypothetical protein